MIFDQVLRLLLGVKRAIVVPGWMMEERPWPLIQPWQRAESRAWARVRVVGWVVDFLARVSQTPGEVQALVESQEDQAGSSFRTRVGRSGLGVGGMVG